MVMLRASPQLRTEPFDLIGQFRGERHGYPRPRRTCAVGTGLRARDPPFPLSSHIVRASTFVAGAALPVWLVLWCLAGATNSVDLHPAGTLSIASASARSMVRRYSRRT